MWRPAAVAQIARSPHQCAAGCHNREQTLINDEVLDTLPPHLQKRQAGGVLETSAGKVLPGAGASRFALREGLRTMDLHDMDVAMRRLQLDNEVVTQVKPASRQGEKDADWALAVLIKEDHAAHVKRENSQRLRQHRQRLAHIDVHGYVVDHAAPQNQHGLTLCPFPSQV